MHARKEVWEYGSLPLHMLCPQLDSISTLLNLHGKLLAASETDAKGRRKISHINVAAVLELTPSQLEVLSQALSALSTTIYQDSALAIQLGQEPIYVHELSLFLLSQLFGREVQRPDVAEVWPEAAQPTTPELLSPTKPSSSRSPASGGRSILRQQLQQHLKAQQHASRGYSDFVRRHLRTALELLVQPPMQPTDGPVPMALSPPATPQQPVFELSNSISAEELDRLEFLVDCDGADAAASISAAIPALLEGPQPLDAVVSMLRQHWADEIAPSPRSSLNGVNMSMSPRLPKPLSEDLHINGVFKSTVAKGENDLPSGEVRITDCHDSVIYILAPLQFASIVSCSDCTVVVGAVGGLLRVDKCDKVQVLGASNRVLITNSHDCSFYLATPQSPCLVGDNRFLTLAPLNTRYERQLQHACEVSLRVDMKNKWDQAVVLAGKERRGQSTGADSPRSFTLSSTQSKACFTLLPAEDFLPFIVPFTGGPGLLAGGCAPPSTTRWSQYMAQSAKGPLYLFPLPEEYEQAVRKKLSHVVDLKHRFKQAGLNAEKVVDVNNVLQAHFKDWLSSSGMLQQIYQLSNLERDAMAHAASLGADGQGGAPCT